MLITSWTRARAPGHGHRCPLGIKENIHIPPERWRPKGSKAERMVTQAASGTHTSRVTPETPVCVCVCVCVCVDATQSFSLLRKHHPAHTNTHATLSNVVVVVVYSSFFSVLSFNCGNLKLVSPVVTKSVTVAPLLLRQPSAAAAAAAAAALCTTLTTMYCEACHATSLFVLSSPSSSSSSSSSSRPTAGRVPRYRSAGRGQHRCTKRPLSS